MNNKTIWIINHYATTEYRWKSGRPYSFSKYLKKYGYKVVVFCASTLHSNGEQFIELGNNEYKTVVADSGVPFVFIKTCSYKGNGRKRVLNILNFYKRVKKVSKQYEKEFGKPDLIIGSSAHILNCVAAIKIARKFRCKTITEVRDLWPESFVAYGLLKSSSPITRVLRLIEKWCYIKSNHIIFTMENAYLYIQEQNWDKKIPYSKIDYINNGVDLDTFIYNKTHYRISDEDLENKNIFKVIYTGSIRKVNNIGLLLDAAKLINEPNIKILIFGFGNEVEKLKKRIENEKINNVVIKDGVEKEYIPFITSNADLNIMHNIDTKIMKYGLSLNKMFDYAAAERPILTDFGRHSNPLLKYNGAISTKDNSKESIAEGILHLYNLSEEKRIEICNGAKKCAVDYDYKCLTKKLMAVVNRLIEQN